MRQPIRNGQQPSPKVAILLCTFNGQRYLAEQLDSFAAQTHSNWEVWASDDGSTDATCALLESFRSDWGGNRLSIRSGPAMSFTANFLSLTCERAIRADHFAYSDQDDVWEADKLARAVGWLQTVPSGTPALYCSRSRLIDADSNDLGLSPRFRKPPSFANALIQNVGGGNTMVFNAAARTLLLRVGANVDVASHDWWTYLAVSGCGGSVFYDQHPTLRYRQHAANIVGVNSGWSARLARLRMLSQGHVRSWHDRNLEAIGRLRPYLTPENRQILDRFARARMLSLIPRLVGIKRSGIYRQTMLGNLGLIAGSIFGKI